MSWVVWLDVGWVGLVWFGFGFGLVWFGSCLQVLSMRGLVAWAARATARARDNSTGIWTKTPLGQYRRLRVRARRGPHSLSFWGAQRKAYQHSHPCALPPLTKSCHPPSCPHCVSPSRSHLVIGAVQERAVDPAIRACRFWLSRTVSKCAPWHFAICWCVPGAGHRAFGDQGRSAQGSSAPGLQCRLLHP